MGLEWKVGEKIKLQERGQKMKVSRNMFFPPSEYKDMGSIMPENGPRNDENGDRTMK